MSLNPSWLIIMCGSVYSVNSFENIYILPCLCNNPNPQNLLNIVNNINVPSNLFLILVKP